MVVYYASSSGKDELYHHGIKGMHWHERRFQNPDGSYTAAGRIRYGIGKAASATKAGISKVGHVVAGAVKTKVAEKKANDRAKAVSKMTATKHDLVKNYDKLTPEERKAALEKFKFQDDLADSMKKDWQRKVDYAKLAFDAIDTGKKIGDDLSKIIDDLSKIMTGKDLAELAKSRNKDPDAKDKEYWEKEAVKAKALLTMENAEKVRLQNKNENDGDVDTYSAGARDKLNRDAAEKAEAEKKQKREEAIQKFNDAVTKGADAVESGANAVKQKVADAADKAKDKYEQVAPKVKEAAKDAYNYTGEAVGKAGTAVYKKVNETAPKIKEAAKDAYNYSGEAVGNAGKKVYETVNDAAPKIKDAARNTGEYLSSNLKNNVKDVADTARSAGKATKEAASSAATLTKSKAEALYKKAGSMAAAAEKAGCSPSTISKFLGGLGKSKSRTSMSFKVNIEPKSEKPNGPTFTTKSEARKKASSEPWLKFDNSDYVDEYNRKLLKNNAEMTQHGMDILDDILRHSAEEEDDELAHFGVKGMKWYQHVAAKTGPSAHTGTSASSRFEKPKQGISAGGGGGGFVMDPDQENQEIAKEEEEVEKLEESIRRLGAVPGQEGIIEAIRASINIKRQDIASRKKRLSELQASNAEQSIRHSFGEDEVASLFAGATFFV